MIKKAIMAGVIILLILSMPACILAATDSQPAIELNGVKIEAAAHIDGGNVYLPLRAIGQALGYTVKWTGKDNPISVFGQGKNIMIDLKNNQITANDHAYYVGGDYLGNMLNGGLTAGNITYLGEGFFCENFGLKVRWERQNGIIQLESVQENAISIKTVKEASETDKIKITLQYPQIDGLPDQTVQDSLNASFRKLAVDARNEGLRNVEETEKSRASGYPGSPNKCETYFDYALKYNQNGLLSVVFMDYQYAGGAHGLTVQKSLTFNLNTGEGYKLKDLMKSDADYVTLFSQAVKEEINKRIKEGLLPDYPIAPFEAIKEDQDFYLSNHAVVVYFQQYAYWPYAAGIQEFPVEFSALKDILKPDMRFFKDNFLESGGA